MVFQTNQELKWDASAEEDLSLFIAAQCAPPSVDPMWQWWESNIVLDSSGPFPGQYRTSLTPMVRWLADWAQNPRVRRIVGMGAAQTIKTQFLLNLFNWTVNESPGTTMWVMADADSVREFWTKRLEPSIDGCALTEKRFVGRSKDLVCFNSMNLLLRGSQSRGKLQSDPVRRLFLDERREWKKGSIDLVRKRTRTFNESQEFSFGTAGEKDDELHCDFQEGSQTHPHFNCLKCGHSQPFRFGKEKSTLFPSVRTKGGLVWETNDTTKPLGQWDFKQLRKTVRYQCEECGHLHMNEDKLAMLETLHPHDYNPAAPPDKKSLHWNALGFLWEQCDWGAIVEEFLRALWAAKHGNIEPLKAFVTETLGEPWEDKLGVIEDFGFLEARKQNYDFGEKWPEEVTRFIAADRGEAGGEHYWWVVRAVGRFGKSRLIAHGRALTLAELEETRKQYGVKVNNAMLDTGWKAGECYRFCVSTGWKAFKGEPNADYFLHRVKTGPNTFKTVRRIWERTFVDPFFKQPGARKLIPLFRHCGNAVKDRLAEYMTGLVGEWTIPAAIAREYMEQLTGERRFEVVDPKGRVRYEWRRVGPNHYFDCECQIFVACDATKLIPERTPTGDPPPKANPAG